MSQTITKLPFPAAKPQPRAWLAQLWHRTTLAWRDAATRRALAGLNDRELGDIGISRAQAQFQSERPVWMDLPGIQR